MAEDNDLDKRNQNLSTAQTRFVELQSECALCGSELDIRVESYLENYMLREEAYCPSCNIKTRSQDHKMQ